MPTISASPDRMLYEEHLKDTFSVRSRDLLRHPEHKDLYNDPALQFGWQSFQAGLTQGRAENQQAHRETTAAILQAKS